MTDLPQDAAAEPGPLPGWFTALRRAIDAVTAGLNVVGTLLIVAIMVLINTDVLGRSLFGAPVSGVPEIVSMSIVAIVFLQVAQAFRKGRLTRSEAVLNFVGARSGRARLTMELVFSLAAIALTWQLIRASLPLFEKAWVRNTFQGTVGDFTAPIWPVKLIILIGCAALLVQLAMFGLAAALRLLPGRAAS